MKTKEFIESVEAVGYAVEETKSRFVLKSSSNGFSNILATVSKNSEYIVDTDNIFFENLHENIRGYLASTLYAYSQTPIAERESLELNDYERMILESLHRDYTYIGRSKRSGLVVVGGIYTSAPRPLDMFEELFNWVKPGKSLVIADLLND